MAPIFWTVKLDALCAYTKALATLLKSVANCEAKAPIKVSPAAVVSTALTLKAGTIPWPCGVQ